MRQSLERYRSFPRSVQLLLLNQLTINLGFYMLMPYLAQHLSGQLGLATWAIGLIMGVRNFSQQGMFLLGGTLADRLGYKPLIVAGCALRTGGFLLLGFAATVPTLLIAAAATGFAGALFNPAVRAYLSHDAGERRVEAFALFNVFYQTGILLGPLVGLALTGITFRLTCAVAASTFAVLTLLQIRALPRRHGTPGSAQPGSPILASWRAVAGNRAFLLFSVSMVGSYVLAYQVYLALPIETRRALGDGLAGTAAVSALFVVSGAVAIAGQLAITDWCKQRWSASRCLTSGLAIMASAFVPPLLVVSLGGGDLAVTAAGSLLVSAALLGLGTVVVFPFEMDTIVSLSQGRLVATHYGLYNTICGCGILAGNFLTGWALDLARDHDLRALPWAVLAAIGAASAASIGALNGRRAARERQEEAVLAPTS